MTSSTKQAIIWVDADACPGKIKEVIFKASRTRQLRVRLVANRYIASPPSALIESITVSSGFDEADNYIAQQANAGDLIITGDVPLAHTLVQKGCYVLHPRGTIYSKDNADQSLLMRNISMELRESGVMQGGPSKQSVNDIKAFAQSFDALVHKLR